MSGIFGAVRKFFKPKGLIGYDLQGNRYFEIPNPAGGRMKRFVEYKKNRDLSEYSRMELRPPVQWRSWLSHTRVEPPTLTELERDSNRVQNLQPMIAAIEAREREERIRQGYLLPDGSVPEQPSQIAGPSTASERRARIERIGQPHAQGAESSIQPHPANALNTEQAPADSGYPVPTPSSSGVAAPRGTIDPSKHSSAEELRRLAMEDTKRRIAESQVADPSAAKPEQKAVEGVEGTGGLAPRRRGRR
ncbi:hypothetical protein IAU60_006395 [Kwoniella sp. DSM 27419]